MVMDRESSQSRPDINVLDANSCQVVLWCCGLSKPKKPPTETKQRTKSHTHAHIHIITCNSDTGHLCK